MRRRARPKSFSVMAKPVGAACNLRCAYCYYLEKGEMLRQAPVPLMADEVLEAFIRSYIQSSPFDTVCFAWQGGEPTLAGLPFFENVVRLQRRHASGKKIANSRQTNGTLIDGDWARFSGRQPLFGRVESGRPGAPARRLARRQVRSGLVCAHPAGPRAALAPWRGS